jgi:hypothetical protein
MPCEAERTSRGPGRLFDTVAVDPAIFPSIAGVDKSQVFALRLNRRKFIENAIDSIRCKFSIDEEFRKTREQLARPPFRNHIWSALETRRSPSASNELSQGARKACEDALSDGAAGAP